MRKCCRAYNAECLSCVANQTVDEYCKKNPHIAGCSPNVRACCLAMTATCLACAKGITPKKYCSLHPNTAGCDQYIKLNFAYVLLAALIVMYLM